MTVQHYRQLYINRPDPIVFLPVVVDTTGRLYNDFSRLLFLHTHRKSSALVVANEIPEESDQFRFLHLSSRSFMSPPWFTRRRHPLPLSVPSLVFTPRCST